MTDCYLQRCTIPRKFSFFSMLFSIHFQILLTLHSNLSYPAQEQIIEYAFFVSRTLNSPENDSIFFHPWFMAEETANFQLELVLTFNKLIDIGSDDEFRSSANELTKAALISVPLTLNNAMQEGVKSVAHAKTICSVS